MVIGQTGQSWTDEENDTIVADYFTMLDDELGGRSYSKAGHRQALLKALPVRSEGSIEFKHQNISAVLLGLGKPWISGYKPATNFQMPLVDAVLRWLNKRVDWLVPAQNEASSAAHQSLVQDNTELWIGAPPTLLNAPPPVDPKLLRAIGRKVDVAAMDARNRALGVAGEERVLAHEIAYLRRLGRDDLAKRVRWTSQEDGDGFGFDIASFETNGKNRLVEVKTTNGWDRTPFHISSNELAVAEQQSTNWCLVRLYDFARTPKAFELRPPLERHIELTPTSFRAAFVEQAN